eukprot:4024322-Amphidinium_carterae.2
MNAALIRSRMLQPALRETFSIRKDKTLESVNVGITPLAPKVPQNTKNKVNKTNKIKQMFIPTFSLSNVFSFLISNRNLVAVARPPSLRIASRQALSVTNSISSTAQDVLVCLVPLSSAIGPTGKFNASYSSLRG